MTKLKDGASGVEQAQRLRKGVEALKNEIASMDVRIAVVQHEILRISQSNKEYQHDVGHTASLETETATIQDG